MQENQFKSQGPQLPIRAGLVPQLSGGAVERPSQSARPVTQPANGGPVPGRQGGAGMGNFSPAASVQIPLAPRMAGSQAPAPQAPAPMPAAVPQAPAPQAPAPPPAPRPQVPQRPQLGDNEEIHVITVEGRAPDGSKFAADHQVVFPKGTQVLGASSRLI